jgi:hypothetical protein
VKTVIMEPNEVITVASEFLSGLEGHLFKQVSLHKPTTMFEALNMLKIVSKISALVGNLFEIDAVEALKGHEHLGGLGEWIRQDPDFPDVLLNWEANVKPGFEVKAWYPMSTEITGRFKDSQHAFIEDATHVVLFAWLPEFFLWGSPKIIKIAVVSGRAIAAARDSHYHNPPDYLVVEPHDTSSRQRNLQQRNTEGLKWQSGDIDEARSLVNSWGDEGKIYKPHPDYQELLAELRSRFRYRTDTNYGKMDRVVSAGVEEFKNSVLSFSVAGKTVAEWTRLFRNASDAVIMRELATTFSITR